MDSSLLHINSLSLNFMAISLKSNQKQILWDNAGNLNKKKAPTEVNALKYLEDKGLHSAHHFFEHFFQFRI
jgi:hypothetical protein